MWTSGETDAVLRKKSLLRLLARREAARLGLAPTDADIGKMADSFRLANGLLTKADVARWSAAAGVTEPDWVAFLRDNWLVAELERRLAGEVEGLCAGQDRVTSAKWWRTPEAPTVWDTARHQLDVLLDAVGQENVSAGARDLVQALAARCGDRPASLPPRWSPVSDDCSPFAYSVTFRRDRAPELRLLVEAQADPPSPRSYWEAGVRLTRWVEENLRADGRRFEAVADLFTPRHEHSNFAMTHALDLRPAGQPLVKVYLDPTAAGVERGVATVDEAMDRLGLAAPWRAINERLGPQTTVTHFSLDLAPGPAARAKVYVRYRSPTPAHLEAAASLAASHRAGDIARFVAAMTGTAGRIDRRPPLLTFAVVSDQERPSGVAAHLHLTAWGDDAVAAHRFRAELVREGVEAAPFDRAVRALAGGPLVGQSGLLTHASYQRDGGEPRLTAYFGARVYLSRYGPIGRDPDRLWPSPLGAYGHV